MALERAIRLRNRLYLMVGPILEVGDHEPESELIMILTDSQKVTLRIDPRNKRGNPAPLDGPAQWSSTDPSVINVQPSADGLSCVAIAGQAGTCQVEVVADADLGDGARELRGTIAFEVHAGEAISLGVTAGAPEEQ
jgi:hypothetical protein